ncbi:MAG: hydroxysqualene dehydroxylase HpnE [Pirellulales bacterium]
MGEARRVIVVGGGLAGLAAADALAGAGLDVTLLESRRSLGGRAASFEDPRGGGLVDACQHVAMGCCTTFRDLCRRAGLADALRTDRTLWFIGPDGRRSACTPVRWLPAPLHLAPLLVGMRHFSLGERGALAVGMLRLARLRTIDPTLTAAAWLLAIGQPERVIRLFWQPVLESALGESLDLVSLGAARKVIVDGFLAHPQAADLLVPVVPLGELLGVRLAGWLARRGVTIKTGCTVDAVRIGSDGVACGTVSSGEESPAAAVVVAAPWRAAARLLPGIAPAADEQLSGSPITAIHLWFDRDIIDLPHAVLVGRTSQWVFRPDAHGQSGATGYCQVVISASRGLRGGDRQQLVDTVVAELREVFPAARDATLRESRVITDPTAVLSVRPGVDAVRPLAATQVPGLFLAGDWTATGWPSTMEGAVRSGRAAATAACRHLGVPAPETVPDLPRSWMTRLLAGRAD